MPPPPCPALLEWPLSWTNPALLDLVENSPFRVLIFPRESGPLAAAAERRRFQVVAGPAWRRLAEIDWDRPGRPILIGDGVWPAMGAAASADSMEAGPTGLPWLESNVWTIHMARDLAPEPEVWIRSDPPEDAGNADAALFAFAQSEARAHGAARPLWLPPRIAAGIAGGNAHAISWWRRLCAVEAWWQQRASWSPWPTAARLRVVSSFAGPDQYLAFEFLNLAARRNLAWRAVRPQSLSDAALLGAAAVLYADQAPLQGALLERLERFARQGGLLLCRESARGGLRGFEAAAAAHPRFRIHRCGKGRVAFGVSDWEDPYLLAQDVHLLMSRRNDVVRLFNPGSILCWPSIRPDRRGMLVHLLNYSRHGAAHDVVVQTWAPVAAAFLESPGAARRAAVIRREAGGWEIGIAPFDTYCALELEGNWDATG